MSETKAGSPLGVRVSTPSGKRNETAWRIRARGIDTWAVGWHLRGKAERRLLDGMPGVRARDRHGLRLGRYDGADDWCPLVPAFETIWYPAALLLKAHPRQRDGGWEAEEMGAYLAAEIAPSLRAKGIPVTEGGARLHRIDPFVDVDFASSEYGRAVFDGLLNARLPERRWWRIYNRDGRIPEGAQLREGRQTVGRVYDKLRERVRNVRVPEWTWMRLEAQLNFRHAEYRPTPNAVSWAYAAKIWRDRFLDELSLPAVNVSEVMATLDSHRRSGRITVVEAERLAFYLWLEARGLEAQAYSSRASRWRRRKLADDLGIKAGSDPDHSATVDLAGLLEDAASSWARDRPELEGP